MTWLLAQTLWFHKMTETYALKCANRLSQRKSQGYQSSCRQGKGRDRDWAGWFGPLVIYRLRKSLGDGHPCGWWQGWAKLSLSTIVVDNIVEFLFMSASVVFDFERGYKSNVLNWHCTNIEWFGKPLCSCGSGYTREDSHYFATVPVLSTYMKQTAGFILIPLHPNSIHGHGCIYKEDPGTMPSLKSDTDTKVPPEWRELSKYT